MKTGIWVVCNGNSDPSHKHLKQMVSKASGLLDENEAIIQIVYFGMNYSGLQSLSQYGADKAIVIETMNNDYRQCSDALAKLIQEGNYPRSLVLFPAAEWEKCVAACLAIKIGACLTAECVDIEANRTENGLNFDFIRAAVNSTLLARIQCVNTHICMCTCKKNAFELSQPILKKEAPLHITKWAESLADPPPATILHRALLKHNLQNAALEKASVVFGVGRGVQNKNDVSLVEQVAKKYNGVLACTRALVEEGLLDKGMQVGQSGIHIAPKIYIAVGISGATQHIVGIKSAKTVLAINTDPQARIFQYSDYYIVEDFRKIFKKLLQYEEK